MLKYFTEHPKTSWLGVAAILTTGAGVASGLAEGAAIDYKTVVLGLVMGLIGIFTKDAGNQK